ncbi:hypothetical protein F5Y04DRAFT_243295 [Hypomontagnella monticulosa]|nr:hypothetical protein F5Y04DRAFT_243295 [Hypomontagnella monticulosa]
MIDWMQCDGARPRCSNCVKRGITTCIYVDRIKAGPEALEVLELLKMLPEDRASALLSALREKGDVESALSIFRERDGNIGPMTPEPGAQESSRLRNTLESELIAKNSKAYPPVRPINASVLAQSDLLRPLQPSAEAYENPPALDADSASRRFQIPVSPRQASYCDKRLHDLQVGYWTDVMVTDDFAAKVISLYITTDHPLLGLFSPHLFIADLTDREARFCSRFLFHALMCLGCLMYSAIDANALRYAAQFREAAEKLWVEQQDSYLTMAGTVLLSLSLIGNERDHSVLFYATQAMKMGERLRLFGGEKAVAVWPDGDTPEEDVKAGCYAAWGAFNWNTLISLFYRQPGSEGPSLAPMVPIPGEAAFVQSESEILKEDLTNEGLLEGIFPAICHFWRIIHRAAWIYNSVHDPPPARFEIALAEHTFRELITLAEALPPTLLRGEGRPHYVTVLHIWLHSAILDVFRPFIGKPEGQRARLTTFSAPGSSPDAACAASVNQLKRLVVEYRSNFAESTYSILWHTGLLYLANAMLRDTGDPEWRLYLHLCIYGYESFSRPFPISEAVVQGLLSMTMRDTDMTGSEARGIIDGFKGGGLDGTKRDFEDEIRAPFMVDMQLAPNDPEEASAENLAAEFDDATLFQDFLHQERMEM